MSKIITNEIYLSQIRNTKSPEVQILSDYIDSKTKIKCRCTLCGNIWYSLPANIRKGRGCPNCAKGKAAQTKNKKSKERLFEYVSKNCSFHIVGNYINSTSKIECRCDICGHTWFPFPSNILKGQGCPKCGRKSCGEKLKISDVDIQKSIPDSLELLNYTRSGAKALFRCRKCGYEWFTIPSKVINRHQSCPKCQNLVKTNEDFLKELNQINPDIKVLEKYVNATTKLKCQCLKCNNVFYSDPHHLLSNKGCPNCKSSKGEKLILSFLTENKIQFIQQYQLKSNINKSGYMYVDFYLPDYNAIIEYNGIQHYIPTEHFGGELQFNQQIKRDTDLRQYCKNNNISLLEISFQDNVLEKLNELADKLAVAASQKL